MEKVMQEKRSLEELSLIDNFLFNEMMMQKNAEDTDMFCRYLLATLTGRSFRNVTIVPQKLFQGMDTKYHGIQLDTYIEVDDAEIVNMEPNNYRDDEAHRTRYYRALVDAKTFPTGEPYQKMKDMVLILILSYDPFGAGEYLYTIRNRCLEAPELLYEDGVTTMIFNTKGTKGNISIEAKQLLRYFADSVEENAVNDDLKKIHQMVIRIKKDSDKGVKYHMINDYLMYERWEARSEGFAEGREEGLAKGREEGREKGRVEGRVEGRAEGMKMFIMMCKELNMTLPDTVEKLMSGFELSHESAEEKVKKYWKL